MTDEERVKLITQIASNFGISCDDASYIVKSFENFGKEYMMSNIEDDVKVLEKFMNNEMQRDKLERDNRCGGWKIGDIYKLLELNPAINNLLSEREQLLKEKKDDKQDIKDFQNALNEENLRCANYAIENNELKKRIKELEAKLEFKKYGDLDEIEFEEYMSHFIPKQKVKDVLQNNRNEIFSFTYVDDEQFKPYTMQIDRINKIEKELLEEGE